MTVRGELGMLQSANDDGARSSEVIDGLQLLIERPTGLQSTIISYVHRLGVDGLISNVDWLPLSIHVDLSTSAPMRSSSDVTGWVLQKVMG
jgi:hypothetical protein